MNATNTQSAEPAHPALHLAVYTCPSRNVRVWTCNLGSGPLCGADADPVRAWSAYDAAREQRRHGTENGRPVYRDRPYADSSVWDGDACEWFHFSTFSPTQRAVGGAS